MEKQKVVNLWTQGDAFEPVFATMNVSLLVVCHLKCNESGDSF